MASKRKADQKLGWHFLPSDMKLRYSDSRKAVVGKTLSIPKRKTPKCCAVGMHASETPHDAVRFKKGTVLCRVVVSGDIDERNDKFCGRRRTIIWAKEIKAKDLSAIAKKVGLTHSSTTVDVYDIERIASFGHEKFDKAIKAWAKKNGWTSDVYTPAQVVHIEYVKKELDPKELKKFLSMRVVRSAKEIRKDLEHTYELDNGPETLEDMLDDLSYGRDVRKVEDYTEDGQDGFVLKLKRKR